MSGSCGCEIEVKAEKTCLFAKFTVSIYRTVKGGTSKMEYVVVGICIVVVAVIVALLIYRRKKMSSPEGENKSDQDIGAIIGTR